MDKTILLRLSDISASYDGKTVFSGVTLDVHAHDLLVSSVPMVVAKQRW